MRKNARRFADELRETIARNAFTSAGRSTRRRASGWPGQQSRWFVSPALAAVLLLVLLVLPGCEEGGLVDVILHVDTPTPYSPDDRHTVHVNGSNGGKVTFIWSAERGADQYVLQFFQDHGGSKTAWMSTTIYPTGDGRVTFPMTFSERDIGRTLRWSVTAWDYDYQDDETGADWYEVSDPTEERVLYIRE